MNINFDWYKHNANYYDLFDADDIPYDGISKTIGKILQKHEVKTIVDLGCGTGNFYIPFARQGFKLLGVDTSSEMISVADKKIKANNLKPNLIQSDIRNPLTRMFDAALCLYNVIGDLNYRDFSKVVENMAKLVRKNGLIGFDVVNFDNVKNFEFNNEYFVEKEYRSDSLGTLIRNTKQKLNTIDQSLKIEQYITVDGKTDNKSVSRCKMYLYTFDQVTNLLNNHRLHPIITYGSYNNMGGISQFKQNDPIIGVVAQKVHD